MENAKKGDWVQIFKVILNPEERAPGLPPETSAVPLTMKVKGFLADQAARAGETVTIHTATERTVQGELIVVNPAYEIDFGEPQQELLKIGFEVRKLLREEADKQ